MANTRKQSKPTAVDFFAGSGLVTEALRRWFDVVWANDISREKAWVYRQNHGEAHFHLCPIETVKGRDIPKSTLSWASFPCQDLSLAGNMGGIESARSGLVWQWLRILDGQTHRTPILVAENVVGLVSGRDGADYIRLHSALDKRGYRVGVIMLDALRWVPQSRPRVFVVAVHRDIQIPRRLIRNGPCWCHTDSIIRVSEKVESWVWWSLPEPPKRRITLNSLIDWNAPVDQETRRNHIMSLVSGKHRVMSRQLESRRNVALPGYRRTRNGHQVLELRFDGVAGCLRTPGGGSSRQVLMIRNNGQPWQTRLLTDREASKLMGAPDGYVLPEKYNDGYRAMGDAVAVPVVAYLTRCLLFPLASVLNNQG